MISPRMNVTLPILRYSVCRYFSSRVKKRGFKEVSIKVPWASISGKWWEPYDVRPILSIHGWQDNCGTFDTLIPLLNPDVGFLAIDTLGHGYSSWLPPGVPYNYINFLLLIRAIVNYFKWPKVSLMGHSLGGIQCYMYTMLFTQEVDILICLDGAKPLVFRNKTCLVAKHLVDFMKYQETNCNIGESSNYTIEELVEKLCIDYQNSVTPESAKYILERNIASSKLNTDKFYFTRDPRLRTILLGSDFCQDEIVKHASTMKIPMFITKSTKGSYYEDKNNFYEVMEVLKKTSDDFNFHYLDGTHHVHLNNPQCVAGLLSDFITKHKVADRGGSITDEIVVEKRPLILSSF